MKARHTAFDGLRTLCFATIIFWHALLPFTSRPRGLKAGVTSEWADLALWLLRGLALKELFLIAGFLAHASVQRYGDKAYLRQRLVRLGLPFLAGWAFYNWLFLHQVGAMAGMTSWEFARHLIRGGNWYEVFSARHLWFLVDLAFMTVAVVAVDSLIRQKMPEGVRRAIEENVEKVFSSPWCPLWLGLPTGLLMWLHEPHFPSAKLTQFAALPFYPLITMLGFHAVFFLVGWGLQTRPAGLEVFARRWGPLLLLGVIFRGLTYPLVLWQPGGAWSTPTYHLLNAVACWCIVLGFLGLFTRYMVTDRPLWRYLADSAFWCYLAHFLFMEQAQLWLNGHPGKPWPLQYLLVLAFTWAGLLLSYELLVRYTVLGRALHGKRQPPEGGRLAALSWEPSS